MAHSPVEELAATLRDGLGADFAVSEAVGFVFVGHADFGIAAVVASADEEEAIRAAKGLSAIATEAGVAFRALHFAVSRDGVRPPWIVRSGASMSVDIVKAMARVSAGKPGPGGDGIARISAAVALGLLARPKAADFPPLSANLLRLAEACVSKVLAGRSVWVASVEIDAKDVVSPGFMLPAILVHAAQDWALPVVGSKGQGGFTMRLTPDPKSILGYKVSGVRLSSPVLLFLPIVNLVRRSFSGGECVLDDTVRRFADFLTLNGLDAGIMGDVDVRVASAT